MVKEKKEKVLILIDEANYYYGFNKKSWDIDYEKFLVFLKSLYEIIDIYFFAGLISKKAFFDSHPEFNPLQDFRKFIEIQNKQKAKYKNLRRLGYRVVIKPVSSIYDRTTNEYKRKCNFDVEITLKAIDLLSQYDTLILCSGDGDFVKLIKYIKGKHRKTIVIGHKDRFNWELEKVANKTIFLESIREKIEKKE